MVKPAFKSDCLNQTINSVVCLFVCCVVLCCVVCCVGVRRDSARAD